MSSSGQGNSRNHKGTTATILTTRSAATTAATTAGPTATATAAHRSNERAIIQRTDALQTLLEGIWINLERPRKERLRLGHSRRKNDGVVFNGVFDRLIGNLGDQIQHVSQPEIIQGRIHLNGYSVQIGRRRSRQIWIRGDSRSIGIRIDEEVDAHFVRVALSRFVTEGLDDFSEGKTVIENVVQPDSIELRLDGLAPLAGVNQVRRSHGIGRLQ